MSLLLSIVLLSLATARQDDVALWAPVHGESVEWRWSRVQAHELVWTGLSSRHGFERESPRSPDEHSAVRDSLELRVIDRIVERDEHAPSQLERFVLHARRTTCSQWGRYLWMDELATTSLFELAFLVFARDPAGDAALARRAASPRVPTELLDDALLAGLDEPLDLRALLGGAPRRLGDAWPLVTEDLLTLVRPGGELAFAVLDPDFEPDQGDALIGWMLSSAPVSKRGRAAGRAVYERTEQRAGARIAHVALRGTIETAGSLWVELEHLGFTSEVIDRDLEPFGAPVIEHTLHLEGELLWDLDAHRAHSLEVEGECRSSVTQPFWDEDTFSVQRWHGDLQLRVTARTVE